jgi:hypothetical protein
MKNQTKTKTKTKQKTAPPYCVGSVGEGCVVLSPPFMLLPSLLFITPACHLCCSCHSPSLLFIIPNVCCSLLFCLPVVVPAICCPCCALSLPVLVVIPVLLSLMFVSPLFVGVYIRGHRHWCWHSL